MRMTTSRQVSLMRHWACYMSQWETDRGSGRQPWSKRLAVSFLPQAGWANSAVCFLLLIKPLKQINKQSGAPVSTDIWGELGRRAFWHDDPAALSFGSRFKSTLPSAACFVLSNFKHWSELFQLVCQSKICLLSNSGVKNSWRAHATRICSIVSDY